MRTTHAGVSRLVCATAICLAFGAAAPPLVPAKQEGSALVGSAPVAPGPSAVAFNPATHTVYVASGNNANGPNIGGNTISVIDARRCNARAIDRCSGPWPTIIVGDLPAAIALDVATDTVYVTSVADNTVSVINGATCNAQVRTGCGQTPATVRVGATPAGIGHDPSNHTVYVANFDDGTVSMIDSATCNGGNLAGCPRDASTAVRVGDGPGDIDVNPQTNTVYVATSGGLSAFDDRTCSATRQSGCEAVGQAPIPACDSASGPSCGPFSAKVDPVTNTIYESGGTTTVWVFDGRQCSAARLASCAGATPGAVKPYPQPGFETNISVVVDPELRSVYVTYHKNAALIVIDADRCNGRRLTACATLDTPEIHTGANPESVALDATTHTLYTADQIDHTVSVIDATRCSATVTSGCRQRVPAVRIPAVPDLGAPGPATADPAVATTYVTGPTGVSMIDTRRCNGWVVTGCRDMPATLHTRDRPSDVAVDYRTHTVYVAEPNSSDSGSISVFDHGRCNATDQSGCANASRLAVPDGGPVAIAMNTLTHTMYVATVTRTGRSLLSVFDTETCNARRRSGCDQAPARVSIADGDGTGAGMAVAVNRLTNTLYATRITFGVPFAGEKVYVIDGATCNAAHTGGCGTSAATISLGATFFGDLNPIGIAVVEATNTVYTANISDGEGPGSVSVIDGASCHGRNTSGCGRTPPKAPAGFGTAGIAVDPATRQVYTANIEDTSVTTIDGDACRGNRTDGCARTVTEPNVGDYPRAIAIDPAMRTGYVSDLGGVSVIRLGR